MPSVAILLPLLAAFAAGPVPAAEEPPPAPEAEPPPLVKNPELIQFVQAPYPPEALAAGVEAEVHLLLQIDETGKVVDAQVVAPVGHGFDEAATAAARTFLFSPAEDATGPVPVIIEFAYGFVLDAAQHEGAVPDASAPPPEAVEAPINLEGDLVEMGTRRPLKDFPVGLVTIPGFESRTDENGHFAFRGVPTGTHTLRAVQAGYDPLERSVQIQEGEGTRLKLWVKNLSYGEDEIVGVYQRKKEEVTRYTLSVQEVRRVPGTFGDPVRVIQALPGAARSPFGTGVLIIRGANPEDSAVYVDGIRIPLIYHLGGVVSVLNSDLVESVDYLPGDYGVRYGRSQGGVIDVKTKHTYPEGRRFVWSTDVLDSGALVTGTAGSEGHWGYAAAARRSYIDLFIPWFVRSGYTIEPHWMDYQVKLDRLGMKNGSFSVFLFGFNDVLNVSTSAGVAQGTDQDTQGDLESVYGTHRLLVNWRRPLGEHLALDLTPSFGADFGDFGLGADLTGHEEQYLLELRAELPWSPSEAITVTPGADFIGGTYAFHVEFPFNPDMMTDYDPLAEREPWAIDDQGKAIGPDFYLDAFIRPLADRERLLLVPGVRTNYTWLDSGFNGFSVDPRFSSRLRLGETSTLKASAGVYHQPPQPFEMYRPDGNVELDYERATGGTIGWEQKAGQAFTGEAEVFYKWLDHQIVMNDGMASLDDPYFFNDGVGRAYGMEVILKREPVGRWFGWISYTLSRSERNDHPEDGDDWHPFELDQTNILVAVGGLDLPRDFNVSTKAQYVTGNPYTPYSGGVYDIDQSYYTPYATAEYNSLRLPPYWSLDLRAEKLFTFKRWQLRTYLDLLNVLHGENPEFVVNNYDYTDSTYVSGLPFIPNLGFDVEVHF